MESDTWIESLASLPKIRSIEVSVEVLGVDLYWSQADGSSTSNLKSLTITAFRSDCVADTIRCILRGCPVLKCLDLTTPPEFDNESTPSTWSEIGEVLSLQGSSLRKIRFDNVGHQWAPGLLDVGSLYDLRYLAVTVDALVALRQCRSPVYSNEEQRLNGNRHGYSSAHDIEDMWAETVKDESDRARRDGSEWAGHTEEEERTRILLANAPDVGFSRLLPDTL
jgi:hypothetical protein